MNNEQRTKEKKKKKGKKRRKILLVIVIILLIIGLFAGIFAYKSFKLGGGLQGIIAATLGHNLNTKDNLEPIMFLALGKSQNLTDTLMICSYNPKTQEAAMLSIPRDTFTGTNKNRATASDKINALYQISPQKTLDAVNKITGLDIKYYAMIDTKSLRQVVDSVGGIYFDVPMDMKYDDDSQKLHINLKKGYQLLNGDKAEQVVRFRHGNDQSQTYPTEYGEQDLGRMRTQRTFLITAAKQILQLKNIFKIGEFIEIAHDNLQTNIPLNLIKDYIPYALELDTDTIKSDMIPGEPEKCNGVWIFTQDKEKTKEIVQELFGDRDEQKQETKSLKVEVLNGSGSKTQLTKVTNLLKENGYNIVKTDTTTSTSKTTIIKRGEQLEESADKLKTLIGYGSITNGNSNNKEVDFTVIIGKDCKLE